MPFLPPNEERQSTEGNPSQSHRNVHALQPLREGNVTSSSSKAEEHNLFVFVVVVIIGQSAGNAASPRNDLDEWHVSTHQWVEGGCTVLIG